jgi:hypothetical protein
LKAHFEVNSRDLGNEIHWLDIYVAYFNISSLHGLLSRIQLIFWADLLKHDKALSKKPPAPHLLDVPDYLLDPKTQEASKLVKSELVSHISGIYDFPLTSGKSFFVKSF